MAASPVPVRSAGADGVAFGAEVVRLRAVERRRRFPLGVHLGHPDGPRRGVELPWPVPAEYDVGLRFDVVDALVHALLEDPPHEGPVWAWSTRPGVPEMHDRDLEWCSVALRAVEAQALTFAGFRAVTRTGWLDVLSGERRTWKRLRS